MQTCRRAGFSKIHAFPFSARRGTPAADMDGQLPGDLKNERVHRLTELETELRRDYYAGLVGQRVQVLVESTRVLAGIDAAGPSERLLRGTTCRYAPAEWIAGDAAFNTGDLVYATVTEADDMRVGIAVAE
jgi:threonylcarbamoyladenosine tRNA methylthiotransferase MtaB